MSPDAALSNEHIIAPLTPHNVLERKEEARGGDADSVVKDNGDNAV